MAIPRDDFRTDRVMGRYHVHICEWCGVAVPCFNGPRCDLPHTMGHCSQACHDRNGIREGERTGQEMDP